MTNPELQAESRLYRVVDEQYHDGYIDDHDDWDCVDDLNREGLVKIKGTGIHPKWELTSLGFSVAAQLRKHRARGGRFNTFTPNMVGASREALSVVGDHG